MSQSAFFDNAPIYTMHIRYGISLIAIGFALGSFFTGVVFRRWYKNKHPALIWEYGTCNNTPARRHLKTGSVQFVLWKAGEQGHKEDFWINFGGGWEDGFLRGNFRKQVDIEREVRLMNWLRDKAQPRSINRNWILNEDKKEYTSWELYEIFNNQSDAVERSVATGAQ